MGDAGRVDEVRPAPEVYRLSIEKLPIALGRAYRVWTLRVLVAATVVVSCLALVISTPQEHLDAVFLVAAVAVITLPYVLWRARRRVRRYWNAFEMSIGAETVRVAARGAGRITIRRDEIATIVEGNSGLVLRSSQPGVVARVPFTVEGYVDVRARLSAWRPITSRPEAALWCAAVVVAALGGVATLSVWARLPGLAAAGWVSVAALAVFGSLEIAGHPHLSRARKVRAVLIMVSAVLFLLGSVIFYSVSR
jgi:hypothetical protein